MHEDVFQTNLFDELVLSLLSDLALIGILRLQLVIELRCLAQIISSIILALLKTPMTMESSFRGSMALILRLYVLLLKLGARLVLFHFGLEAFQFTMSNLMQVQRLILKIIGQKPILLHHTERFPQLVLFNS